MKKFLLLAALLATATSTFAQGVVLFNNRVGTAPNFTVDAPITNGATGLRIDGADPQWKAALYGAVGTVATDTSMTLMSNPTTGQSVVGFRTGGAAGYVNVGTEGARGLAGLGYSSSVTVQIRAWDGGFADYASAVTGGAHTAKSNFITITTTANATDPNVTPTAGINGFIVPVPEPSSIALGLLGLGAVALIRRRK